MRKHNWALHWVEVCKVVAFCLLNLFENIMYHWSISSWLLQKWFGGSKKIFLGLQIKRIFKDVIQIFKEESGDKNIDIYKKHKTPDITLVYTIKKSNFPPAILK